MKLRVTCLAVAAAAGLLLSGCQTKVGAAAVVDGQRISESSLQDYVQPGAKSFSVQQQDGSTSTISPPSFVLQQLIVNRVLLAVLLKNGGAPTSTELKQAQATVLGSSSDADVVKVVTDRGFDKSFEPVLLRSQVLIVIVQKRITDATKLAYALGHSGVQVSVSGRYGTWDAAHLSLNNSPATPDFIATESSSAPALPAG